QFSWRNPVPADRFFNSWNGRVTVRRVLIGLGRVERKKTASATGWKLPLDREVLFNALVATAVDGIIVIDEIGRMLVFSDSCERLFGYARSEVLGKNIKVLMPPPYHAEH